MGGYLDREQGDGDKYPTINLKIFLPLVLLSGRPSSVRRDAKIRRAAISLLGIGDCALMIGSHDPPTLLLFIYFFATFSLTEPTPCHY